MTARRAETRPALHTGRTLVLLLAVAAPATAQAQRCHEEVGWTASRRLVRQCIQVSPATHPPCNSANPCAMITAEIRRGCQMLGQVAVPAFCRDHRGTAPTAADRHQ